MDVTRAAALGQGVVAILLGRLMLNVARGL